MARKQLHVTLEDILAVTRAWRQEYARHGKVREGGEVADYNSGSEGPRYSGTETCEAVW